jgi:hypothetical protein
LRTRLSDSATDKYIHLSPVDPEPNGISRQFAVPDTRLVTGSVKVFLDNEELTLVEWDPPYDPDPEPTEYVMLDSGRIVLEAPDTGAILKVSYYFQWFTDEDLTEFLNNAARLLGNESAEADSLTVTMRTPVLSFAAHYAYLKMAANAAQALQAGAGGFTADNTAEHPNWMALAKLAWETGQAELEVVGQNPSTVGRPALAFVNYAMSRYVPRS